MLGRVVGEVWGTRKAAGMAGYRLLVVAPTAGASPGDRARPVVAADTVDAGVGDSVLVCFGEPARRHTGGSRSPVRAAVMAVVDRVDWEVP